MKTMLTLLNIPGVNTFQKKTSRKKRAFLRDFEGQMDALGSNGMQGKGDVGIASRLPGYVAGMAAANAIITPTAVNAADTVTINGQALTAIQQRATGTLTAAATAALDTAVINGVTFTAVSGAAGANQFDISSANNTTIATNLAAAINASITAGILGVVAAKSAAAVVTVFAIVPGTAGNSLTLVGTAVRLVASGATLSGGIAVANNQFDMAGTDTTTASSLADCINNSSTAIINGHVRAGARSATITLVAVAEGQTVTIGNVTFFARNGATTLPPTEFDVSGNDTADAASLVAQINAHPWLSQYVWADNAANVVTVRERPPVSPSLSGVLSALAVQTASFPTPGSALPLLKNGAGLTPSTNNIPASSACMVEALIPGQSGNAITIASSNGARLPILGSATRLLNGTDTPYTF